MNVLETTLDAAVRDQQTNTVQCAPLIRAFADLDEPPSATAVNNVMKLMHAGVRRHDGVLFDMPTHLLPKDQPSSVLVGENLRIRNRTLDAWVTDRNIPENKATQPVGSLGKAMPMKMPLISAGVKQIVVYLMHDGAGAVRLYYQKQGVQLRTTYLTLTGVLLQQSKTTERV